MNRCVFGKDCNSTLSFKVVGVHNPLLNLLVLTECTALFEKLVNKRCLAVIDVSDNCDISEVFSF